MDILGKCDLCEKPAQWAVIVSGCSEHKATLKAAIDSGLHNTAMCSTKKLADGIAFLRKIASGNFSYCVTDLETVIDRLEKATLPAA